MFFRSFLKGAMAGGVVALAVIGVLFLKLERRKTLEEKDATCRFEEMLRKSGAI